MWIINDSSKFSKLDIASVKEINHIINFEKKITSELKLLKQENYWQIYLQKYKTGRF